MNAAISVLIPTRKRVQLLPPCIESVLGLAAEPEQVEILLGVDDDDPSDYAPFKQRCAISRNERWGYTYIYRYYNDLASRASGQIFIIWNDDLKMLTPGWDLKLREHERSLCVQFMKLDQYIGTKHIDTAYAAVSRQVFDALGHLSFNCHIDTCLARMLGKLDAVMLRHDVVVQHDRGKILDEIWYEKNGDLEGLEASGPQIERDVADLVVYLDRNPQSRLPAPRAVRPSASAQARAATRPPAPAAPTRGRRGRRTVIKKRPPRRVRRAGRRR